MTSLYKIVSENGMCSLPWLHVEVSLANNSANPCCKFQDKLETIDKEFPVVWFGNKFNELRSSMLSEQNIKACAACDVPESVFSYKKWKNQNYLTMMDAEVDAPELPKVFHFALTNTCNLACRMCLPSSSSKLTQLVNKSQELKKYFPVDVSKNKVDIEKFKGSFSNARSITITGGEPLIDEDCLTLIKMVKDESLKLRNINFSTNMTKLNYNLLKELSSINANIQFSISIDGPPHINEYIRTGTVWKDVLDNIKYIRKNHPRFLLAINSTVSILNVGYIPETLEFFNSLEKEVGTKFRHLMISPVLDKPFLHPSILPDTVRNMYIKKLTDYNGDPKIPESKNLILTGINMLQATPRSTMTEFLNYISEFDKVAGTDYLTVYPEFGADGGN